MNLVSLIDYLRDRLRLVIGVCIALLAGLVVLDVVIALTAHHPAAQEHAAAAGEHAAEHAGEAHGFWQSLYHIAETVPGFWAAFGFIACTLIIFVSKAFGHMKVGNTEIMTREDYYNE